MALSKKQREILFNKYNGLCAYCGCELKQKWHADHISPLKRQFEFIKKGNIYITKLTGVVENPNLDIFENLNPSCQECNIHKGSGTLEQFRTRLSNKINNLRKNSKDFRFAEKFEQILITPKNIVFYYEKNNQKL